MKNFTNPKILKHIDMQYQNKNRITFSDLQERYKKYFPF